MILLHSSVPTLPRHLSALPRRAYCSKFRNIAQALFVLAFRLQTAKHPPSLGQVVVNRLRFLDELAGDRLAFTFFLFGGPPVFCITSLSLDLACSVFFKNVSSFASLLSVSCRRFLLDASCGFIFRSAKMAAHRALDQPNRFPLWVCFEVSFSFHVVCQSSMIGH